MVSLDTPKCICWDLNELGNQKRRSELANQAIKIVG